MSKELWDFDCTIYDLVSLQMKVLSGDDEKVFIKVVTEYFVPPDLASLAIITYLKENKNDK